MKRLYLLFAFVAALCLSVGSVALAQEGHEDSQVFQADLQPLNGSGASGTATMTLDGNQVTVDIESQGLAPNLPHAQHIHGEPGVLLSTCPTVEEADQDGDGLINTVEGEPFYGGILTSITTEGDTGPDSGLAVDRFPVADENGNVSYSRTFAVSDEVAANLDDFVVVQHGIDFNGSGEYDFENGVSSIDPELPLQATIPANCGQIEPVAETIPDTGGPSLLIPGAALLLGSGFVGLLALRRFYGTS